MKRAFCKNKTSMMGSTSCCGICLVHYSLLRNSACQIDSLDNPVCFQADSIEELEINCYYNNTSFKVNKSNLDIDDFLKKVKKIINIS